MLLYNYYKKINMMYYLLILKVKSITKSFDIDHIVNCSCIRCRFSLTVFDIKSSIISIIVNVVSTSLSPFRK